MIAPMTTEPTMTIDNSANDESATDDSDKESDKHSDNIVSQAPALPMPDAKRKRDEEELDYLLQKFWPKKTNCREKLDERHHFCLMATELNIKGE